MYVMNDLSINIFNTILSSDNIVDNVKYQKSFIYVDSTLNEFILIPIKYYNTYGMFKISAEFHKEQIGTINMTNDDLDVYMSQYV